MLNGGSAKLLIDQHGNKAPIEAAMKADAMLKKGYMDGRVVRLRILRAVEELLDTRPKPRTVMSSIMRWHNGLMVLSVMGLLLS